MVMNKYSYGASWGFMIKAITLITLICCCVPIIVVLTSRSVEAMWLRSILVGGPILLVAVCAMETVCRYELRDRTLIVHRLLRETVIDLSGLISVRHDPEAMKGSIRVFGIGGLFSFTGLYWNRTMGWYRAYVMDPKQSVVLRLERRQFIVSPDHPEKFVAIVKATFCFGIADC